MNNLALTPAEQNERDTIDLVANTKMNFLELGHLLVENQKHAYWSRNGHHSFAEYIETLGVGSKSWVYRLVQVADAVLQNRLTKEEVMEIGVGKTCLLLPQLKGGKVDADMISLAKRCPTFDLRLALGLAKEEDGMSQEYIICPKCGANFPFYTHMVKGGK